MAEDRYEWALTPSKFEASAGCACFEENPWAGKENKDRGTDLHSYMEHEEWPLDKLPKDDADAVQFCRDYLVDLRATAGPFLLEEKELYIHKCNDHPSAKIDYTALTRDGLLIVVDWKFGAMEVPAPEVNAQIKSYAFIAWWHLRGRFPQIQSVQGGIVQPALQASPSHEFALAELEAVQADMFAANDRVIDPFRQPDPSDPLKCARCKHAHRCPAVCKAVATFGERNNLLPAPDQFEPGAIVSVRQRVIAQDFAKIVKAWAEQVMEHNKEFAVANGGTLGGIWNISTRGNGAEIEDVGAFAEALIDEELMADPLGILPFVKIRKTELIEGLATPERPADEVAMVIKGLERKLGVPRPPVTVFRRGGAKAVKSAEELLGVPQLVNPWPKLKAE